MEHLDLENNLRSIFKSLSLSLTPHFIESKNIHEGCRLVCIEDGEILANHLVLLGLDGKILDVFKALYFASEAFCTTSAFAPGLDSVFINMRDWFPTNNEDGKYPSVGWNLVRMSQAIARSICLAIASGCFEILDQFTLDQKVQLYSELSAQSTNEKLWRFYNAQELIEKTTSWLADNTTSDVKYWHQKMRHDF
jgi:hypothetical protein